MVEVEIGELRGQAISFGQTRAVVFSSVPRNSKRSTHRVLHGFGREIGRAGMSFALAQIHRHAHTLVTVVFDGFDFGETHGNILAYTLGNIGFTGRGTFPARHIDHLHGQLAQGLFIEAEFRHVDNPVLLLRYHTGFTQRYAAMSNEQFDNPDDEIIYVSKSEMKRDMTALQELGEKLATLDKKQLATLNLPERLYDALIELKRLTAHGAVSRQKQFIGKLMRHVDPAPIQELLDKIAGVSDRHSAWLHKLERLRETLLTDTKATEEFIAEFPQVDVQRLRQMIRNAQKEREQQKPPKNYRELFQFLKEYIPEPPISGVTVEDTDDE